MNATEQIMAQQVEWALNKGLGIVGSRGDRGRKVYTKRLQDNLFQPLTTQTRIEFEECDGGELIGTEKRPAKIQALHSSSALGIKVFDYRRNSPDLSFIASSCWLSRSDYIIIASWYLLEQGCPLLTISPLKLVPILESLKKIPL